MDTSGGSLPRDKKIGVAGEATPFNNINHQRRMDGVLKNASTFKVLISSNIIILMSTLFLPPRCLN
jgi:hypothetical protein